MDDNEQMEFDCYYCFQTVKVSKTKEKVSCPNCYMDLTQKRDTLLKNEVNRA